MCDEIVKVPFRIKDDSVRPRRPARVRIVARQDREFIPRARSGEVEALVVIVLVRIATYKAAQQSLGSVTFSSSFLQG